MMKYFVVGVVFLSSLVNTTWGAFKVQPISEVIDNLFTDKEKNPNNYYDKRVRPSYGGSPVIVQVSAYVLQIFDVDGTRHEFTAQLYFRQKWTDYRLEFASAGISTITLDHSTDSKLWIPDTFIVNERSSTKHDLTVPNIYTRLSSSGEILRSIRITVTASCPQNLRMFPFDSNICVLELESYGYTMSDSNYKWAVDTDGKPNLGVSSEAESKSHRIIGYRGQSVEMSLSTGNYSRLTLEFLLKRVPGQIIQGVYIPHIVIVLLAFATMGVGLVQLRILLSFLCMLGSVILHSFVAAEIPKTNYWTLLYEYVVVCNIMISIVIIVNMLTFNLLKQSLSTQILGQLNGGVDEGKELFPSTGKQIAFDSRFKKIIYIMLFYSRYAIPCIFIIFNMVYWVKIKSHWESTQDFGNFTLMKDLYEL